MNSQAIRPGMRVSVPDPDSHTVKFVSATVTETVGRPSPMIRYTTDSGRTGWTYASRAQV